jgi:hypothetical protein
MQLFWEISVTDVLIEETERNGPLGRYDNGQKYIIIYLKLHERGVYTYLGEKG